MDGSELVRCSTGLGTSVAKRFEHETLHDLQAGILVLRDFGIVYAKQHYSGTNVHGRHDVSSQGFRYGSLNEVERTFSFEADQQQTRSSNPVEFCLSSARGRTKNYRHPLAAKHESLLPTTSQ